MTAVHPDMAALADVTVAARTSSVRGVTHNPGLCPDCETQVVPIEEGTATRPDVIAHAEPIVAAHRAVHRRTEGGT